MSKTNQPSERSETTASQDSFRGASEQLSVAANVAKDTALGYGSHYVAQPARDVVGLLQDYARSRPEVAAAWCFGLGLFIGWKLRP